MTALSKVLVASHLIRPDTNHQDFSKELKTEDWQTESDLLSSLHKLGYENKLVGIFDNIHVLGETIKEFQPDVVFNLVERFSNDPTFDQHIVSYLELMRIPYTGCGPVGMALCKNKGLSKKILSYHRILVPDFAVFRKGKRVARPKKLEFPIFVKPLTDEASIGISQASFVETDAQLLDRVAFIHGQLNQDAIAEEYIDGRELYVGVIGNPKGVIKVFPAREMTFGQMPEDGPRFASYKAKWDEKYRSKWGIANHFAKFSEPIESKLQKLCKKIYTLLDISGYARLDLRLDSKDQFVFIEANPNPMLSSQEDFAMAAIKSGLSYEQLIDKILKLGLQRGNPHGL